MGKALSKSPQSGNRMLFTILAFACFGISLLIHGVFFQRAGRWVVNGFSPESYDTIVPRTFRMKHVEIDPSVLEEQKVPKEKQEKQNQQPVALDQETPKVDQVGGVAGGENILLKPGESLLLEKPVAQVQSEGLEKLLTKSEKKIDQGMPADIAMPISQPLTLPEPSDHGGEKAGQLSGAAASTQQFSTLDDLLAHEGGVPKNTAPILMPTDLLFEYDSDTLRPEAAATLAKLGSLIKKNALASFRIEGHTDSFGTDDYNMNLSLRRAEAVKAWLKNSMGLDAARISTVGMGKSRLLVPATGTVEQQQLNRRVEIVITLPK